MTSSGSQVFVLRDRIKAKLIGVSAEEKFDSSIRFKRNFFLVFSETRLSFASDVIYVVRCVTKVNKSFTINQTNCLLKEAPSLN